jgi:DNA helicase II / ATP-dependent DNA helicase PcrA
MQPTPEQEAIVEAAQTRKDSLLINALAGAAKTTTLDLICRALPPQTILSLAFNKRIAEEMKKRLPGHVSPMTLNSIGHRVWGTAVGKRLVVDTKKSYNLLKAHVDELPRGQRSAAYETFSETLNAIRQAKIAGYIPESLGKPGLVARQPFFDGLEDEADGATVDAVLCASIRAAFAGAIDFDDQIYMSTLFGGSFPQYPLVMVDEAQDLSGINHAMLERLASNSRLIAVGDPWQSIYAFRGAVNSSMARLESRFGMSALGLSISFRCPRAVVRHAHKRVPHMRWPEWAAEGKVQTLERWDAQSIADGSAVICRNNAPLFSLALRLIRSGRGVQLVGTDIGSGLVRALRKLGPETLTQSELLDAIESWETAAISKKKPPASVHDKAECLRVFAKYGRNLKESVAYAEHLFKSQGPIQLLSGHKAKGLEWSTVYHLDPWRIPSKYASSHEEVEQEKNVEYVITTRAKEALYLVNLEDFR